MHDRKKAPEFKGILCADKIINEIPVIRGVRKLALAGACSPARLGGLLEEQGLRPEECLLLASTDEEIRIAGVLNMAAAAYVDGEFPGQTFAGVWMVIEGFEEVDGEFLIRIFQRHHNIPWVIAETERCVIRELALADVEALAELYDRPGITCRMGPAGEYLPGYIEPLYPLEEELEYQKHYIQNMYRYHGYGMWLVFDKKSGELIGRAGLENREYPEGVEPELGYLIHPDWQRRGIATEVCSAILTYSKERLEFDRVSLLTDGENLPSVRLAEKLGFVYAGDTEISGSMTRKYVFTFAKNREGNG